VEFPIYTGIAWECAAREFRTRYGPFAPRREMHYDHDFLSGGSSVQAWLQLIPVNRELRNGIARQIARRVIPREMCIIHASYSAFN